MKNKATNYEAIYKKKNIDEDPFLIIDSFIMEGTCTAIVCCVGLNSTRGIHTPDMETKINTPL